MGSFAQMCNLPTILTITSLICYFLASSLFIQAQVSTEWQIETACLDQSGGNNFFQKVIRPLIRIMIKALKNIITNSNIKDIESKIQSHLENELVCFDLF